MPGFRFDVTALSPQPFQHLDFAEPANVAVDVLPTIRREEHAPHLKAIPVTA